MPFQNPQEFLSKRLTHSKQILERKKSRGYEDPLVHNNLVPRILETKNALGQILCGLKVRVCASKLTGYVRESGSMLRVWIQDSDTFGERLSPRNQERLRTNVLRAHGTSMRFKTIRIHVPKGIRISRVWIKD